MSIKEKKLENIVLKIRHYHQKEGRLARFKKRLWILYHEIVRDDVMIRAESLSYFTMFSMMPIVAGLFLLLSAVSQWAPVQSDFEDLIRRVLKPLPDEHRDNLLSFIFEFKNTYLQKVAQSGSSLGIFALVVLVVIMAKVYFNMEDLMNRVWSVQKNRALIERARNFILAMVILPISILSALSVPGLLEKFGGKSLGLFVEKGLPVFLLLGGLFFLFRYFPNIHVRAKNAFKGAVVSVVLFSVGNVLLKVYFAFGTETAYGKVAVIPIFAFFIYVSWIVIMIGAEWSYVLQNEKNYSEDLSDMPNLGEGALLLKVLELSEKHHQEGKAPLSEPEFAKLLGVAPRPLNLVLEFLVQQKLFIRSEEERAPESESVYSFAFDPSKIDLIKTVKEFLKIAQIDQKFDVSHLIQLISEK